MKASMRIGIGLVSLVVVVGSLGAGRAQAETVYVSMAGNDASGGRTWATAKRTVQAGLNAAVSGDEVWVAAGPYVECITLKAGVAMYGGFVGTETDLSQRNWTANVTTLDGNRAGSVVTVPVGAAIDTRIDGFVIRNGSAGDGGGIFCYSSSPTITNNTITGNLGGRGGGIYYSFTPTMANNTITNNDAYQGGGIYSDSSSQTMANNTISNNTAYQGGGIYCANSSSTITNNTISNNDATYGGGIYCNLSSLRITDNTIVGNSASYGGGIHCHSSSATITNNTIAGNAGTFAGGGICNEGSPRSVAITNNTISGNSGGGGGGIYCGSWSTWDWSSAIVENNTITGNTATSGGGIYNEDFLGTMLIANNTIAGNSGANGGGVYCTSSPWIWNSAIIANNTISGNSGANGGGICCAFSSPWISSNVIIGNSVAGDSESGYGGGVCCTSSSPWLASNTIVGNSASQGGGISGSLVSAPIVTNTIIAFNSSGIYKSDSGSPMLVCNCVYANTTYNYSGLTDPTGSDGNLSVDPKFVGLANAGEDGLWGTEDDDCGDLRLLPGSPCIDAGSNAHVPDDITDLNGNRNLAEPLPFDLAGAARFCDDPVSADTGSGTVPIVDIGAYEYLCGDISGNGYVDVVDLLYLVNAWGSVIGDDTYRPTCDFNHDDSVDIVDLLILAGNWGT